MEKVDKVIAKIDRLTYFAHPVVVVKVKAGKH